MERQFAGCCIAAMESHESIFQCVIAIFALDVSIIQICRNRVVDIKQCNNILADNGSDELGECTVDINLAGYRNTFCSQAAVDIAGNESELCLESRPAFSSDGNIFSVTFVIFNPVQKSQFILSQFGKDFRLLVTCTKLFFHIGNDFRNSLVICMFVECLKQIKLRVLLNLNIDVVKLFNRSVTCKEVQWTRTEADNL